MSEKVVCAYQSQVMICHDKDGVLLTDDEGESISIGWLHVPALIEALRAAMSERPD